MPVTRSDADQETYSRLRLLMFFRVLFTTLLLSSTIVTCRPARRFRRGAAAGGALRPDRGDFPPVVRLCRDSARTRSPSRLASLQVGIDTLIVTLVILVTGSFASIFSFLYLVVIHLFELSCWSAAAACSWPGCAASSNGVLVNLEFFGLFVPFVVDASPHGHDLSVARRALQGADHHRELLCGGHSQAICWPNRCAKAQGPQKPWRNACGGGEAGRHGRNGGGMAHELKNPLAPWPVRSSCCAKSCPLGRPMNG
jgi:hypothetical protein